jgi:hypothetical protein
MTDRVRTLTVILDTDMRDDDVEWIVNAIRAVKHVADVTTHSVGGEHLQREIAKSELRQEIMKKIQDLLYPKWTKP